MSDGFDLDRVYSYLAFMNNESEVFDFVLLELAFFGMEVKVVYS